MLQGVVDYLLSNNTKSNKLRSNFIFYIFPMLNIDGVINGSYRCNLAGVDLNRQWSDPNRRLHPSIFSLKN